MPNLFKLLKKAPTEPLPGFPAADYLSIPAGSALLFYSGNKVTEMFANRVYEHPYAPPAFHAALTVGDGKMLNVGKFKTIESIKKELISTRRVDAIIYGLTDVARLSVQASALADTDKPKVGFQLPTYGFTDYLRFGLKWFRPSKKDICSENVVELLANVGFNCSERESYNTAPWHLLEWALHNPDRAIVKTIWIGAKFVGR